jgi:hypothetical protein
MLLLAYCADLGTYFVVADRLVKADPALEVEPKLDWRSILPTLKPGTCYCSQAPIPCCAAAQAPKFPSHRSAPLLCVQAADRAERQRTLHSRLRSGCLMMLL